MNTPFEPDPTLPAVPVSVAENAAEAPTGGSFVKRVVFAVARAVIVFVLVVFCLWFDITDPEFAASLRRDLE